MTLPVVETATAEPTEHPHIVRVVGVCGGRPLIKGTRISVSHIAVLYKRGASVEEIVQDYPHLTPAGVHDAISYYLDHQGEIEQEIADGRIEALAAKYNFTVDERGFVRFNGQAHEG